MMTLTWHMHSAEHIKVGMSLCNEPLPGGERGNRLVCMHDIRRMNLNPTTMHVHNLIEDCSLAHALV